MEKLMYKDTDVFVEELKNINTPKELKRICFCCGKEIDKCDAVLLANNYKIIPNMVIHSDCFAEWKHKTSELLGDIENSYNQWKQLNNLFG